MRQFLLIVAASLLGLVLAAPACADDHDGYKEYLKRLKEQQKREREFYKEQQKRYDEQWREQRKREDEHYRELAKRQAELYREQRKRDEEGWKEYDKRERKRFKGGKGHFGQGGYYSPPGYGGFEGTPRYGHYAPDRRPAYGHPGARFEFRFSYPAPYRPALPLDCDD